MRRWILSVALVASVALSVCPAVEAVEVKGTIKEIDTMMGLVVLDDGTELRVVSGEIMAKIHEGDTIEVVFEEKDGQKVVSSVEVTGQ
jgi:Cu/Ag efflux protein CusF